MATSNDLLKRRDTFKYGSDKWRELNRAALLTQSNNQIKRITNQLSKMPQWKDKPTMQRQDYARDRMANHLSDLSQSKKVGWLRLDLRRVRDEVKSGWGN